MCGSTGLRQPWFCVEELLNVPGREVSYLLRNHLNPGAGKLTRVKSKAFFPAASMVLVCVALCAASMPLVEIGVKAAFLFNLAQFVEWPPEQVQLTFCVMGADRLDTYLEPLTRGKSIAGRSLSVRYVTEFRKELTGCSIVYIGRSEKNRIAQIVRTVQGSGVLLISEYPELGNQGVVINFFIENDRVRFEIDRKAAAKAGIKLRAQLLKLARIAGDGGNE